MPKYMVTGTIPYEADGGPSWGSIHTAYRNGEIHFEAKNLRAAQGFVVDALSGRKLGEVHALYSLEGASPKLVPFITPNARLSMIEVLLSLGPTDEKVMEYSNFSDAELQKLFRQVQSEVKKLTHPFLKHHEKVERVLNLLKRPDNRREIARAYLMEIPDEYLDRIENDLKNEREVFVSAAMSDWLRPDAARELFGK